MNKKMEEIKEMIIDKQNKFIVKYSLQGQIHTLLVDKFKILCENHNHKAIEPNYKDENKDKNIVLNRCGKIWESFHEHLYKPIWGDYNFHTKNFAFKNGKYEKQVERYLRKDI
jgi:hypothetical protein